MAKTYFARKMILLGIFAACLAAAAERFYYVESMYFFPLYHWELGFGKVHSKSIIYQIFLTELNNRSLKEELLLEHWLKRMNKWQHNSDYKLARSLAFSLNKNPESRQKIYRAFNDYVFTKNGYHQAKYYLKRIEFDPLDHYHRRGESHEEVVESFIYNK